MGARTATGAALIKTLCLPSAHYDVGRMRVAISPRVRSAFVAGVFRPTIYLPAGIAGEFVPDQVEMVLRHEWIHVRQGDCLWTLLSRISCAISWLNPLTWILARKLNLASEELCDELVLASGVEPAAYADCLLRIAESMLPPAAARLVGAGVFPTQSHLSRRISLMLNNASNSSATRPRHPRIKVFTLAAAAACGACMIVSASPLSGAHHDSTPEATLNAWFDAINQHNWSGVFSRIEGAKVDLAVATFTKPAVVLRYFPKIKARLSDISITGDLATLQVTEESNRAAGHASPPLKDRVELKRTDGDWKIVRGGTSHSFIEEMVEVSKDPALMARAQSAARITVILSNLKQIALGVFMYLGDHDDIFSLKQATLKSALKKYIKDDNLWLAPDGEPLDVRINPYLLGKSETQIPAPANCVLLTLGPQGSLHFLDGRTVVAFADGHVKGMNQASAAHLSWK